MSRWLALPAWLLAAVATFGFWWWQGRPVALPDAPSNVVPCLSFAPYRGSQSAMDQTLVIPAQQIEEDLRLLSRVTRCVRTYSVGQGVDRVPEIARRLGMTVMLGAWIGSKASHNTKELDLAIDLANRFPDTVSALIVGNEVLLRGELSEQQLVDLLRKARASVSVPVTYADVWAYWFRHRDVADAVDFVTIHILPYWDDDAVDVDQSLARVRAVWNRAKEIFQEKPLFVGETGWPSAGRMRDRAAPSPVNQADFVRELLDLAETEAMEVNLIEAFDQPWKRAAEGTVGGYWGLLSEQREAKFAMTGPVSDDPSWRAHFIVAAVISALPIIFALISGASLGVLGWFLLAFASHASGCALVVAFLNVVLTSITAVDWAVGVARCLLAAMAFALVLTAVLKDRGGDAAIPGMAPVQSILAALRSRDFRRFLAFDHALGLVRALTLYGAAVVTVTLVFDPRHRDFPIAVYAVPALAFFFFAWRRRQGRAADFREEIFLAIVLGVGGVWIALFEGFANYQAVAWSALSLLLAGTIAYEVFSRRRFTKSEPQRF